MRLFIILLFVNSIAFSQISKDSEISIITIGPGKNLYEKFGHTGIRIKDDKNNIDYFYNYGIFDFRQSNFYWNFTKGLMNYKLAKYSFFNTLNMSHAEGRWVKEQILNLSFEQKLNFYNFLENNTLPRNASYLYDPFNNNCSTKARDLALDIFGSDYKFIDNFPEVSLRDLMNSKIHQNTWGSFGINLALGSKLDRQVTPMDYAYLPEYLYQILENSYIKNSSTKAVKSTNQVILFDSIKDQADSYSPFLIFGIVLLLIIFISYRNLIKQTNTRIIDFILLFSTGITGCILLFLWFFTEHSMAPYNFNLLWAFAPNLFISFLIFKKDLQDWVINYIKVLLIFIFLIPLVWIFGIQKFNWTIVPLLTAFVIRYVLIIQQSKRKRFKK